MYTSTGELAEAATDVALPGRGPSVAMVRAYGSGQASVEGPLGFGWSWNLGMTVSVDATSSSTDLATASPLDVTQENGTDVQFTRNADGSYSPASAKVLATLTRNSDGTLS
jgi:hypothetical protein